MKKEFTVRAEHDDIEISIRVKIKSKGLSDGEAVYQARELASKIMGAIPGLAFAEILLVDIGGE